MPVPWGVTTVSGVPGESAVDRRYRVSLSTKETTRNNHQMDTSAYTSPGLTPKLVSRNAGFCPTNVFHAILADFWSSWSFSSRYTGFIALWYPRAHYCIPLTSYAISTGTARALGQHESRQRTTYYRTAKEGGSAVGAWGGGGRRTQLIQSATSHLHRPANHTTRVGRYGYVHG